MPDHHAATGVALLGLVLFGATMCSHNTDVMAQDRYWAKTPGAMCVSDEDHDAAHAKFHEDFYRKWLRPDTGTSCCNMRVKENGTVTGDCRPTPFRQTSGGHWQAQLDDGTWIKVPDDRIVHEVNPDPSGVDGHLCEFAGTIYCAVPPFGGG